MEQDALNARSQAEENAAKIDYVSMMTDVEFPEVEEETNAQ